MHIGGSDSKLLIWVPRQRLLSLEMLGHKNGQSCEIPILPSGFKPNHVPIRGKMGTMSAHWWRGQQIISWGSTLEMIIPSSVRDIKNGKSSEIPKLPRLGRLIMF